MIDSTTGTNLPARTPKPRAPRTAPTVSVRPALNSMTPWSERPKDSINAICSSSCFLASGTEL